MNKATKAGTIINFEANSFRLKASFHSTPVLERKRRNHWDFRGGTNRGSSSWGYTSQKKNRKLNAKQALLHNVSAFAEHLFQSWQSDYGQDEYDSPASQSTSWFRHDFRGNRFKGNKSCNGGPHMWNRRGFQFCEDDDEIEFETSFGNRHYFYSFINEEPQWRNSYDRFNNHRYGWDQKYQYDNEYYSSNESDSSESDVRSDRLALGLSASGPLSLADVKNAYRACALKWHPDRHQGSCKVEAEEKFKACSTAYQSLCDKLALN